jgi:ribosomal protein S18 acetylase RimI-like enzyme
MSIDDELYWSEQPARDRAEVASLQTEDLEALVRVDAKLTGCERRAYMMRKLDEALLDSGVRVSLTARLDGLVAGFLMARLDFGDMGHAQPTAVIDTIGVDPGFSGQGIGKALISQLLVNLRALQVERVETTLAQSDLGLLGFLYRCGFAPSERIALEKCIS